MRAYPRGRGATGERQQILQRHPGLSPRARGNPILRTRSDLPVGPIPAGAGQPRAITDTIWTDRAYPRGRGATALGKTRLTPSSGLSPRARGNPRKAHARVVRRGPIPAGAGQPFEPAEKPYIERAYPRGRGATRESAFWAARDRGLSPRARGNPCQFHDHRTPLRPIPAGAGQPYRHAWQNIP